MKRSLKIKTKKKEKPCWDNTISDLNVYKLSSDELLQRKLGHISKNKPIDYQCGDSSTTETVYDRLTKIRYGNQVKDTKGNNLSQRKNIIRNMFTTDKELFDLFDKSEKTLYTVESMYGDPLKRYQIDPTITRAPDFNEVTKKSNTNNSNHCVLNEHSESENESSKSDQQSVKFPKDHSENSEDSLSKFKNFIENERKVEESLNNRRNKLSAMVTVDKKLSHASTETDQPEQVNDILQYTYSRLVSSYGSENSFPDYNNKDLLDKIIDNLVNVNKKNTMKIELLNTDLNQSKELIDALTLELINNREQVKRMKNEYELFTRNVTSEISEMKSLFIKYLDQQVTSNSQMQFRASQISSISSNSTNPRSTENGNLAAETTPNNTDEILFNQQLSSLQLDHKQTQKRLKNLLKIQDSISQMSDDH